ncbi:co-chaperone DjlA [Saccharobesus litoralis]|uniref:Co-chaperone protein DjlA n=1 Tax=Saccharobesus litoralis TaxID=2172099 RepID=A0A2S0VRN8_9ALTE|nr:co-chaperone DjlA [Saccharobesus litoralis]AWB66885.1 co-chaperone DjlA [Saccharobesus litoralis]
MQNVWGKVIGLIFGYMFAKIPGAILGVLVGHSFDKGYSSAFNRVGGFASLLRDKNSLKSRALFFHTLFSIMGHIAKSGGRVTEADIALASLLMERLGLSAELKKEAQAAYREGKQSDFPVKETAKEFKRFCAGQAEFIQMYLEIQIQAALINGQLNAKAEDILHTVGKILGYSQDQLHKLISQVIAANRFHQESDRAKRNSHQGTQQPKYNTSALPAAYQMLGLDENCEEKQAKKAYKKLMAQHHPDKLASQGLPEQALQLAKEKAQDIQAAWQLIKEHKGW